MTGSVLLDCLSPLHPTSLTLHGLRPQSGALPHVLPCSLPVARLLTPAGLGRVQMNTK